MFNIYSFLNCSNLDWAIDWRGFYKIQIQNNKKIIIYDQLKHGTFFVNKKRGRFFLSVPQAHPRCSTANWYYTYLFFSYQPTLSRQSVMIILLAHFQKLGWHRQTLEQLQFLFSRAWICYRIFTVSSVKLNWLSCVADAKECCIYIFLLSF